MIHDTKLLESYVRDLLESLPDASLVVNSTGRMILANVRAANMFGYESQEFQGVSLKTLIPERFQAIHADHCRNYFANPRVRAMGVGMTLWALKKDGTEIPVEISLSPLETNEGTFVIGAIRDISHSESRYRAIFEQIAAGVVHSDLKGRFLDVNPKFCQMVAYSREEVLKLGMADVTHPDDVGLSVEERNRLIEEEHSFYEREARLIRKDRAEVWALISTSIVKDIDRRPLHFISVVHDISKRKRIEQELRRTEAGFRSILEQSLVAVYVLQDGNIVYANPRMHEIFGYRPDEPANPDSFAHIKESDRHGVEQIRKRLNTERSAAYSVTALRKDGTEFTLGVSATKAIYRGKPAIIAMGQDITEKERAEAEIKRHIDRIEKGMRGTIKVIANMGEQRDPYTHGHERRVGELAAAIAAEMGLEGNRVEGIRVAGYLHDVGKIGVPAEILSKPTRLTKVEFELVKNHAQIGYEILKDVDFPWPVAEIAWQHHERIDGSGYPRGLKGDQILPEARILAVADTVEAMSSHRPYRPGLGIDAALAAIEENRGKLYCTEAVDACVRLFRKKAYSLPS